MKTTRLGLPTVFLALALILTAGARGLAAEEIELLDGTILQGEIRGVQPTKIVVETLPGKTTLEIPLTYLSPLQQYRAKTWRLKPGDLSPNDPNIRMQLAKWCFEHRKYDARLLEKAELEFRRAEELGGDDFKEQVIAYLDQNGIKVDEHGKWMSEAEYAKKMGWVKDPDSGQWMTPEALKAKQALEEKELKTKVLVPNPNDYSRVSLPILAANRSMYFDRNKKDKFRKVRFWGHFLFAREEFKTVQAEGPLAVSKDKYVRVFTGAEDATELFVNRKKHDGKVAKKLKLLKPGDRVQVYGRVYITERGFLILVDDIIAW
jgi:hypothetical protein